jgi:hypothetical protein
MDGFDVTDVTGAYLGCVTDVWSRAGSPSPDWGRVVIDTASHVERAVPLRGASRFGSAVTLAVHRDTVLNAPADAPTPATYEALCRHYGLEADPTVPDPAPAGPPDGWP